MTPAETMHARNLKSIDTRASRAAIGHGLRSHTLTIADVLTRPEVQDLLLIEVVVMCRGRGWRSVSLGKIGELAVEHGVNLMMPVAQASVRQRRWVAKHGALGMWTR